ncbi:MAG: hydrogenase maturation protease [Candidatus Bipolaricaulia bacterium]
MMDTAIVGVGNILMKDDGVGVHVARALVGHPLPVDVCVLDAGTDPYAAFEITEARRVIVIDAAQGDGEPGTIYRLPDEAAGAAANVGRSCHDMGLLQTLRDSRSSDHPMEIIVIGIEPRTIDWGLDLSPEIAARVPHIIEIVLEELRGYRC